MHLYKTQTGETLASAEKVDLRSEEMNLKYSKEIEILEDSKLIAKLGPKHREIWILRNTGLSYIELAEKLEIPIGSVMSRLFWARKNMERIAAKQKKIYRV